MRSQRILLALLSSCAALFLLLAIPARTVQAGERGDKFVITGSVRDEIGRPLPGARVRLQGSDQMTETDGRGAFALTLKDPGLRWFRLPITAGKEGWFNNGVLYQPGAKDLTIYLSRVPTIDYADYPFMITSPAGPIPPQGGMMGRRDCGNCHTTHLWEWGPSKMGQTTRNPKVLEAYKQFSRDRRPDQANSCADCHAPLAALQAPGRTDYGFAVADNLNISKGIECDFCHKISKVEVGNKPGVQAISMTRFSTGGGMMAPVMAYGPYDDVVTMPMAASYKPLFTKSEFCSSCHQDATPLPGSATWDYKKVYPEAARYPLYEQGKVIPNQWTYQEWLEWQDNLPDGDQDKGRQCQDCHMNWTKDMVPYYRYVVSGRVKQVANERDPAAIFPHKFEGATPKRLEGAARLHVVGNQQGDSLKVTVGVTNVNAGHRLPTGQTTRNLILLVRAETESGALLKLLDGPVVPSWGGSGKDKADYSGRPGKGFARITADGEGRLNVPVWRATRLVSDNRIKAKETDESSYTFQLPASFAGDEPVYITASLIYRKDFRDPAKPAVGQSEDFLMQKETITLGENEL